MLVIDGSMGEGGGQVLRTSLALSICLGVPFRIVKIRAGRPKPGLGRQHLAAVQAAAAISGAQVEGATLGSQELAFAPGPCHLGDYRFSIGTAGSTTLVLQAILPPLALAGGVSSVYLCGGTHNPQAPPYPFVERTLLPVLARLGVPVTAQLLRPGFYPRGGGELAVTVGPSELRPGDFLERGAVRAVTAEIALAGLPDHIARREAATLQRELEIPFEAIRVKRYPPQWGPGNTVSVFVQSETIVETFTAFGRQRLPAEHVAAEAAAQAKRYLAAGAPVGPYLADQLPVWLALAGRGSFRTLELSRHTTTNLDLLQRFLDLRVEVRQQGEDDWFVQLERNGQFSE
ncbi:MAG: RNA 3'-terminal phosphate cyclase [Acidobacteriota bacterium]